MISLRDLWRIFLIFLTLAVLLLASAVGIQKGILPTSPEKSKQKVSIIEDNPDFAKQAKQKKTHRSAE